MRQAMWVVASVALAGCASGGATSTVQRDQTVTLASEAGTTDIRVTRSDPTAAFAISAPPDRVFRALTTAYEDLGLSVNALNTQTRRIGVENARIRRQIGGQRMSRYIECGERLGQRVADSDDITLTVVTQVVPDGANSTLRTLVDASARPIGTSGNLITCATTGALEQRIVDAVKAIVARP